ncbi:TOBE domain protein [compost metagenome]
MLRPEAIQCSAHEPGVANRVRGRIRQRVFKGNHTSLKVEIGEGHLLNALVHPSEVDGLSRDDIWVGWSSEATTLIPSRNAS